MFTSVRAREPLSDAGTFPNQSQVRQVDHLVLNGTYCGFKFLDHCHHNDVHCFCPIGETSGTLLEGVSVAK